MVTFIISILLFLIFHTIYSHFTFQSQNATLKAGFHVNSVNLKNLETHSIKKENKWYLEIPSIQLNAEIKEGTDKETMNQYIGHFIESQKWNGNICLAAHNRGYENNYFSEVKKLKKGETIIYHYLEESREYLVEKNFIIQDTDFTYIENTPDNKITLITCVENEPNYRRCVQAIEKERKEEKN